jgi:hypothetical protein
MSPEMRFYIRKYGLTVDEARQLTTLDHQEITRRVDAWRESQGGLPPQSPLVRGYLLQCIGKWYYEPIIL